MFAFYLLVILFVIGAIYDKVNRRNKDFNLGFWLGVSAFACSQSLVRDYIGKEAFVAIMNGVWVSTWIAVPAVIGVIATCILSVWWYYRINEKKE